MISEKMTEALNEQIGMEAFASFLYLSMASWCNYKGLNGCAQFFQRQSEEEREHMLRIYNYLSEMDVYAITPAVDKVPDDFESIQAIFKETYKHEQTVTQAIFNLTDIASSENDHSTFNFLQWYIEEQREEENLIRTILDKIKIIGEGPNSLYFIDKEVEEVNNMLASKEGSGTGE